MSHNKSQSELKSVLKKYLDKTASHAEFQAVDTWYEGLGKENTAIPDLDRPDPRINLASSIKKHLNRQIFGQRKTRWQPVYIKYAAVFLLLIGTGIVIYQKTRSNIPQQVAITFTSNNLAAKEVTLHDGSVVLLNVGSELRVADDFGATERNVSLKGEAFFKIAKDKRKPFIISTGSLKTTVVGTSFNINAYPDLNRIKVAVATGKVKVSKKTLKGEEVIATGMTKDASLTFDKLSGTATLKTEDSGLISSWKDSKLYIDNATITEIAKQLGRYYHIRVIYDERTDKGKRYTIRFDQEPANRVMEILSMLTKIKFTYQTNQITIK